MGIVFLMRGGVVSVANAEAQSIAMHVTATIAELRYPYLIAQPPWMKTLLPSERYAFRFYFSFDY